MTRTGRTSALAGLAALLVPAALLVLAPPAATAPAAHAAPAATSAAALAPAQLRLISSVVGSGFTAPTGVTGSPDSSGRVFVTEQRGLVKVLSRGVTRVYLDLRAKTAADGERGLLGIAFHPQFTTKPFVFVTYVRPADGALVLSRFQATRWDAATVSPTTERALLVVGHSQYANHNGGALAFSRSGYLLWGIGDGGGSGDPLDSGQNLRSLLGKVLRLDVDKACGSLRYCIPPTNPYAGSSTARREIWLSGVRNPWRISTDRGDGSLWVGDVGQNRYEEADRLPADRGGYNLGWSCREGFFAYDTSRCRSGVSYTGPVFAYAHSAGCSITGGYVYRGSRYPAGRGSYVATDYCSGNTWAVAPSGSRWASAIVGTIPGNPVSFGESGSGELYAVSQDGTLRYLGLVGR